jgi:hypothetical protein
LFFAALTELTALCAQTQTKKNHESVTLQRFHDFSFGSFDRLLY